MIREFVIPFDKKGKERKVNGINFLSVDTAGLNALTIESIDTTANAKDIFELLCSLISFSEVQMPLQLSLFLDHSFDVVQNLAVLYLKDGTILPVRFLKSRGFSALCNVLLKGALQSYYFIINAQTCKGHPCGQYLSDHDPFNELGSWITKIAPRGFAKINDLFLKDDYLSSFMSLKVREQSTDFNSLLKSWKQLLQTEQLKGNDAIRDTTVFHDFKEATGFELPKELQLLFSLNDGVETFVNGTQFLSASNVLQEWKNWNAIYKSIGFAELVEDNRNKSDCKKTIPISISPFRVPFMHDGGGNFIAIDLLLDRCGTKGQIVAFGVDEITVRFVAENMDAFLQHFVACKYPKKNNEVNRLGIMGLSKFAWLNNNLF